MVEENEFVQLIGEYIINYANITNDVYDVNVIKFVLKFWDACMLKQFHQYSLLRYLNDFRFQVSSDQLKTPELDALVEEVKQKQTDYLMQQLKNLQLDTSGDLENDSDHSTSDS